MNQKFFYTGAGGTDSTSTIKIQLLPAVDQLETSLTVNSYTNGLLYICAATDVDNRLNSCYLVTNKIDTSGNIEVYFCQLFNDAEFASPSVAFLGVYSDGKFMEVEITPGSSINTVWYILFEGYTIQPVG